MERRTDGRGRSPPPPFFSHPAESGRGEMSVGLLGGLLLTEVTSWSNKVHFCVLPLLLEVLYLHLRSRVHSSLLTKRVWHRAAAHTCTHFCHVYRTSAFIFSSLLSPSCCCFSPFDTFSTAILWGHRPSSLLHWTFAFTWICANVLASTHDCRKVPGGGGGGGG